MLEASYLLLQGLLGVLAKALAELTLTVAVYTICAIYQQLE
jgi:hypothetical protein